MLLHFAIKNKICVLSSKQSSLFSFYALPSGGKSKDAVVHLNVLTLSKQSYVKFALIYWFFMLHLGN